MRRVLVCVWTTMALLMAASPGRAADEIVAYAQDVTTVAGNWAQSADSSAAGGRKLSSADYGWSTTSVPLASSNDYFEIPIEAAANTPYHVWVRMRAGGDSKWNDSVWLQFSDAVASEPLHEPVMRVARRIVVDAAEFDVAVAAIERGGWKAHGVEPDSDATAFPGDRFCLCQQT